MDDDKQAKRVAIAAYSRSIGSALEQRGIDAAMVFEKAGVPMYHTSDPLRRMTNAEISALFRESVAVTGDPYFGLFVAEVFHISQLHALGFALLSSATIRDFCLRLQNFYRLASQNLEFRLLEADGETILAAKLTQPDICWETVDAFAGLIVRLIRTIGERHFTPVRVELVRPVPVEGRQPYLDYFGCDVLFDQPEICICFDNRIVDLPLPGGSQELAQSHDRTAMEYLGKLDRQNVANRVRGLIVDTLSTGLVSKQQVADGLNMGTRNLELKLADEDTNFQQILDSTRQSLASGYMEQSGLSITEIAYLLGFSDAANFTRAFRRWTGKSPSEFRKALGLT
jgi:AraC-like DNA-binding protein